MRNQSVEGFVHLGLLLALGLLLLALYLVAKGTRTVAETYGQHPGHPGMTAAGVLALLGALGTALSSGNPVFVISAVAGALVLWSIASVVQVQDDKMLQRGWSLDEVVHPNTWWTAA